MNSLAIRLIINYAKNSKITQIYIFIMILNAILQVFVSSFVYKEFLNKNIKQNFDNVIKHICLLWISLFIVYIFRTKLEAILVTDISMHVRKEIVHNYLKTNEILFSEKDVEKDRVKILDFGFLSDKIFIWFTDIIIPNIALMIITNLYIFYKSPIVGILNLLSNIMIFLISKHYFSKIMDVINKRHKSYDKLSVNIGENLLNLMNIHLNDKIDDTMNKTSDMLDEFREIVIKMKNLCKEVVVRLKSVFYFFNFISILVLYKIKSKDNISDFFQIFTIFTLYMPFFENFLDQIPLRMFYLADYISLGDYFVNNKKVLVDNKGNLITKSLDYKYSMDTHKNYEKNCKGNISFKNISFHYPEETVLVINNFSLDIKEGERLGLLAKSGSGKTTLMKLLLGFYKPQKGSIILDNVDINDIHPKLIRKQINYTNQKTLLINDTIINNIKFGNNKSDKYIIDFMTKYNLINVFQQKNLNKIVDVSGKNMSMGMQKVIFLLRGILRDSCVYVFDEPLTSLDNETRKNVIKMIDDNTKGKTLIIITHDDEILKIVDKTIHM